MKVCEKNESDTKNTKKIKKMIGEQIANGYQNYVCSIERLRRR